MSISKSILVAFVFFSFLGVSFAQTKGGQKKAVSKMEQFEGIVVQKPWTKSTESYCAQGSEYFVLQPTSGNQKSIVLKNNPDIDFSRYVNKKVVISGRLETRIIEANNDPMEQRPSTGLENNFKCTVLEVKNINISKN